MGLLNDGWINWEDGACPVPGGTYVLVRLASNKGMNAPVRAGWYEWRRTPVALRSGTNIIAYKLADPVEHAAHLAALGLKVNGATPLPEIAVDTMAPPLSGEDLVAATQEIDPRFAAAHYGHDLKVGDQHEALTFHELPVRDSMTTKSEPYTKIGNVIPFPVKIGESTQAVSAGERPGDGPPVGVSSEPGLAINPKDAIGSTKLPLHLWPAEATAMGCLGMLEGAAKYGRNNFIAGDGVIASIYVDAAKRHLDAWFAGEEESHDVGAPHLGNALATIGILVKAQAHGKLIDDRDYSPQPNGAAYRSFVERITPYVKKIQGLFKDKNPRHYTISDVEKKVA